MPEVSDFFTYGGEESRTLACSEFHDALGSAVPEDIGVEGFFYSRDFGLAVGLIRSCLI